jgi:hypothetical protein
MFQRDTSPSWRLEYAEEGVLIPGGESYVRLNPVISCYALMRSSKGSPFADSSLSIPAPQYSYIVKYINST